ncbi:MAG TPA: hypothetical protein VIJ38_08880 [Acidobacteriaceae bacterium]
MKKLSNITAKLTGMKFNVYGVLAATTLAGAVLAAGAPAAQAQRFGVAVRIGGPRYYAPAPPVAVYGGYGYSAPVVYGNGYAYGPVYGDRDGWRGDDRRDDRRGWGDRDDRRDDRRGGDRDDRRDGDRGRR